jgi:transcriptional regulator with XRE-family HTH domain
MPARPADPALADFGAAVRKCRQRLGLSQEALADVAGIHRTYIGDVERGMRNVSLLNILRISRALDIEASNLMQVMEGLRRS